MERGRRGRGYPRRGGGQRGGRGRGFYDRRNSGNFGGNDEEGRPGQDRRGPYVTRPIGYKRLEEMAKSETPRDIINQLTGSRSGLEERLRGDGGQSGPGMICMLSKVFAKMSEYDEQTNQPLIHVLDLILTYDFLEKLISFIYGEFTNPKGRRGLDVNYVTNALKLMNMLLTCVPKTSEKKVSMHLLILTNVIDGMGGGGEISRELLQDVKDNLEALKERQRVKQERKVERGVSNDLHSERPPGDFREIPVFPQLSEIQGTEKPFLRTNLIDRGYQNVDHYLDVQYRLLREDFIRPLREGIQDIMFYGDSDRQGNRFQNVKVYQGVRIAFMKPDPKGILHTIQFSTEKLQRVRWRNTKRLLYGNLLCLSSDQFKDDVLFAVVADRKPEDLEQGYLTVQFVHEEEDDEDEAEEEDLLELDDEYGVGAAGLLRRRIRNRRKNAVNMDRLYTMVETEAYFEAYRHVLAGLRETEEIPLERYIVSCEPIMQAPEYLRPRAAGAVLYDFSCVMENGRTVEVLHYDWPSARELNLDTSQYEALKLALTNELAIIQGPPGTGKTYVGLEIMKILLKNKDRWAPNRFGGQQSCPILVVCYTNHALDQFLEGIAKFTTENQTIVRVGGRCKNEVTKEYSLNEIRRKRRAKKVRGDENAVTRRSIWELRSDMKVLEGELQRNCNQLEASLRIIQKFEVLEKFIPGYIKSQFYAGTSAYSGEWMRAVGIPVNDVFLSWLGLLGGEEEPDFAAIALNVSEMTRAILMSMGYTDDEIGRAYNATGEDNILNLDAWIQRWRRAENAQGTQAHGNDAKQEDDEEDDGNMEEADLVQEGRILDTDDVDLKATATNNKENERHVKQLMKQMAALTFEDISGHIASGAEQGWQRTGRDKKKAKQKIKKELGKTTTMTEAEERRVHDIHVLSVEKRWKLYRTWVSRWREQFRVMSDEKVEKYNNLARRLQDLRKQEDADIIRGADVVAITTTGAAKYRDLIYKMNCKIVVVEEAAEVLEAHIITAMPLSTKHLILIGDHQQLKPSPTVYKLAKDYHLDTSLFERLMGKIPHVTLTLQHRMKPEIAELLRPRIYKELLDHESVLGRPEITGVAKSMFFVSHNVSEESVADGRSKKNQHEADFLIQLCKYLIMQGYETHQITILAMYTGQLFAFRNKMREEICRGVRVTAVDNFQGEENDIILLSLVRSNDEARIGFLGVDNRICVALSRAKHALYCIGNLELLASKSTMWRKIVGHLLETDATGEDLALQCKHHPDKITLVKHASDFSKVPEGGCGQPCGVRLACGHVCPRPCHPEDHSRAMCGKRCDKVLACGHACKRKCWQDCGSCRENVMKTLQCGHQERIMCYQEDDNILCTTKVQVKLSCGHQVSLPCHRAESPSRSLCTEECRVLLECEHPCKGSCNECFQGRLHVPCRNTCNRGLVCGHECKSTCSACPPCKKKCLTKCKHSKCGKMCGEPCILCRERCDWECPHHKCTKLCCEPCNRPPCNVPCPKMKACGHPCIGLCGEPCPKLCRVCDKKKVTETFFGDEDKDDARFVELEDCGHVFIYESLDTWLEQEEQDNAIKMKECPLCKTPIWRSTRYGRIINDLLNQVNRVKTKMWGDAALLGRNIRRLSAEIVAAEKNFKDTYILDIQSLKQELKDFSREGVKPSPGDLYRVEQKLGRLEKLSELKQAFRKLAISSSVSSNLIQLVSRDLECIRKWVMLPRNQITDHESSENASFARETDRIKQALKFIEIEPKLKNVSGSRKIYADFYMASLKNALLRSVDPYDEKKKKTVEQEFKILFDKFPEFSSDLGISDDERQMICKAMGFAQKGHWYKCPKGHIYAIGDCGGATMTSKCPECQEEIGGEGHRLSQNNRVASEMDGATRPAYDPHMNYVPENLLDDLRRQGFG